MQLRELDENVTYASQLQEDRGPIVLPDSAVASPHVFEPVAVPGI